MKEEVDLDLEMLPEFYGTQHYYNVMGILVTDGIKYIMENGYSWFVTDAIVLIKMKKRLKNQDFLSIRLKTDREAKTAMMIIDDGNDKVLYKQKYTYTDAKRDLTLFYCDNVLMLASEY